MVPTVEITVYSDIACPWCAIGHANLKQAIKNLQDQINVKVVYQPYSLHPEIPEEGIVKAPAEYFGKRIAQAALDAGITLSKTGFISNTTSALSLIKFAETDTALQNQLVTVLFRRYFQEGQNVGDQQVLVDAAVEAGLSKEAVEKFFQNGPDVKSVGLSTRKAREQQIFGVPHYIFNDGQYQMPGGQEPRVFELTIRKLASINPKL